MTYGQIDENMVRMRVKQTIEILVKNDKYVFGKHTFKNMIKLPFHC